MKSVLLLLGITAATLWAADYDERGMKLYKKLCMSCHGSPDYAASRLDQEEWEDLFAFHAQKLLKAHAKESALYGRLRAASRKKRFSHLADYLINNAKDSGSVGGCDGNRCGFHSGTVPIRSRDE